MQAQQQYPQGAVLIMVGTKRGLFLLSSRNRETWEVEATSLRSSRIFNAALDQRDGHRMFATDNGDFFGTFLRYSDDFGQTWHEPQQGIQFAPESEQKLVNIWVIEPGRPDEPGTLYAGVDPASLWISTDHGEHWEINEALANQPTREQWNPGAGGLCLHTIVADPTNARRMWVGISAVGCVRTDDGGKNWVFVIVENGMGRYNVSQQFTIYRTRDGGESWEALSEGLPGGPGVSLGVLRHGMCADALDPCGVYVGTNTGQIFASSNGGDSWKLIADYLPPIYSVRAVVIE